MAFFPKSYPDQSHTDWSDGNFADAVTIGVEWDPTQSSPTLQRIDLWGNPITPTESQLNGHAIFGMIKRCSLTSGGVATFGSDAKGTGLPLTSDYVMTRIPRLYIKTAYEYGKWRWWLSPIDPGGFSIHPAFLQRGHALSPAAQLYIGSYNAGANGGTTANNGTSNCLKATSWTGLKLTSKSGVQPLTGDTGTGTMSQLEAAANLIGTGWGITNVHTWAMLRLLAYIRLGTLNTQSAVGAGRTNAANTSALTNGSVAAKEDSMGRSSGTSDTEGVTLFGIENIWGNIWHFLIGYNTVDAEHRIIKRDGTGTLAETLTSGNYDAVTSPKPLNGTDNTSGTDAGAYCHGYASALGHDTAGLLDHLMIPSALSGAETQYLCDDYYSHQSGISQTGVLLAGGNWASAGSAGVGCLDSLGAVSDIGSSVGARLEYIG